jgi:DNA repair exonuclease SbcCD nuclease subunit
VGRAILEPYGEGGGAYLDLPGGVRVYGLKYYGASTGKVFGLFAQALAGMDHSDVQFTILMAHAGLEGQLAHYSGALTHNDLAPLQGRIDYLALGHIHKPYDVEGWIYNPGSPETWNIQETAWPHRGCYLVDIQPGSDPSHQAQLLPTPRRPFHRSRLQVDALTGPDLLYDAVRDLLQREAAEVPRDPAAAGRQPVVELTLSGVLPFSRFDLDLDQVQGLIDRAWKPLITRVRNLTTPADFEVAVDAGASRPELERAIVGELLERDARYRLAAEEWTQVALDLKRLALEDSAPGVIIDHLRRARAGLAVPGEGDQDADHPA